MRLEELTGPITQLAVAWSAGDNDAGEILFNKMMTCLEPRARSIASRCDDQRTVDVLNSAYLQIRKSKPRHFENRSRFFGLYLNAMKFWRNDYISYWTAQKRSAALTCDLSTAVAPDSPATTHLLLDIDRALARLVKSKRLVEVDVALFIGNKVFGVSQTDLAQRHDLSRDLVGASIRFVKTLLRKELHHYASD